MFRANAAGVKCLLFGNCGEGHRQWARRDNHGQQNAALTGGVVNIM